MKRLNRACICALVLVACLSSLANATEYAALEGKSVCIGGGILYMNGDNASGSGDSEFMPEVHLLGFTQDWVWRAFVGGRPGDNELLIGGSVSYAFAHNYEEAVTCGDRCSHQTCELDVWWIGAGPSVIIYRELFESLSGSSVDGEELGLSLSAGATRGDLILDLGLHYYPDSESTLITAGLATALR